MAATDYDFTRTRNEIIKRAFRIIGVLSVGDSLGGNETTQGAELLDTVVKNWQVKKTFLWTLKPLTASLLSGTRTYTLSTDPAVISIERAYLRDSNNIDTPLDIVSWTEYHDIPNKTQEGTPCAVTIDYQAGPTLYVYPVPSSNSWTLFYLARVKSQDWDNASDTGEIPAAWIQPLVYALAVELAYEYGIPIRERQALEARAFNEFREASGFNGQATDSGFVKGAY